MTQGITLNGESLTVNDLVAAACGESRIDIEDEAWGRMTKAREIVEQAIIRGDAVYGLTTGLGARVGQALSPEQLTDFSYQTLRGRAHAIGRPLTRKQVRAAMIIRLNSLLKGMTGTSLAVVKHMLACLNHNIIPVVGETGSIGAGDLCLGATMGMALIGEGEMMDENNEIHCAKEAMSMVGLVPLTLGPRDGLALANHSSFSAAIGSLALSQSRRCLDQIQIAAAMTMEAFRANLTPMDDFAQKVNPQSGQAEAARQLRELLQGSCLFEPDQARRLQDPLSIRNVPQVHGAVFSALDFAIDIIETEINASSDNPVVDCENEKMISCGAYHTSHLTLSLETVSRAMVQAVMAQLARMSKLLSQRYTDLPLFLAQPGADSNGFAPCMKVAESLVAEVCHLGMPVPQWPSVNADGTEDVLSNATTAAKALDQITERSLKLSALEMIMASQALELRGLGENMALAVKQKYEEVRSVVAPLGNDRPMTQDIENLARYLRDH